MQIIMFLERYFLLFILYAFGGWIIEEIHCSFVEKKIVNRGFLIGPICPIYGFGGIIITAVLTGFQQSPVIVFGMAILLSAILEYFTSYILEKIFNARWWDYSNDKYNIDGRVCLRTIIPFGIFGLLVIYVINPYIFDKLINMLGDTPKHILSIIFFVIWVMDTVVSCKVVKKVTQTANDINQNHPRDNTNEITKKMNEELKQQRWEFKRFIEAFPNFTIIQKVKEVTVKSKEIIKQRVSEIEFKKHDEKR